MILYPSAKFHPCQLFQTRGSVFPFAFIVALPCACLAVAMKLLTRGHFGLETSGDHRWAIFGLDAAQGILSDSAAFSGINFLIGFLIIFRTSQAYARFWEGHAAMHEMRAQWFDAASSLIAFCKNCKHKTNDVIKFQHTLIRLISLLHATALMQLCVGVRSNEGERDSADDHGGNRAFELELIDAEGLDENSLITLNETDEKVALLFQWVQQLCVDYSDRGIFTVQPPILTRAFAELASGMVKFHDALKISEVPFPFPYMQTAELLLVLHWIVTPFLISNWTTSVVWTFLMCFLWVFIFWSLHCIAIELENPFGEDTNDLPAKETQSTMNQQLLLLLRPCTLSTPRLSTSATFDSGESECLPTHQLDSTGMVSHREDARMVRANRRSTKTISLGALRHAISRGMTDSFEDDEGQTDGHKMQTEMYGMIVDEVKQASERAIAEALEPMVTVLRTLSAKGSQDTLLYDALKPDPNETNAQEIGEKLQGRSTKKDRPGILTEGARSPVVEIHSPKSVSFRPWISGDISSSDASFKVLASVSDVSTPRTAKLEEDFVPI